MVPSGKKPLPEQNLTQVYGAIRSHAVSGRIYTPLNLFYWNFLMNEE